MKTILSTHHSHSTLAGINRFTNIRAHGLCEIFPNIFGAFHLEEALDQGFAFLD